MGRRIELKLEQFHARAIEKTRRAGLSAYLLMEDGTVMRIWPDGKRLFIMPRSTSGRSRTSRTKAAGTVGQRF